jgi:hypothetical protein
MREDVWRGHEQLRAIVLAGAPPEGDKYPTACPLRREPL